MNLKFGFCSAAAAMLLSASSQSATPATAAQKIASVHYLVGTWNCRHTVGTFSGTYTTNYARVLGDLWLKQTYDFPPKQMSQSDPGVRAEFLMGYDEQRQAWVRFGTLSNGQYFAIRLTDTADGGWGYKYVSFFKRQRPDPSDQKPEMPDFDAVFSRKGDSEYMVDGPSYEQNGVPVTEHHVCKKS